MFARMFRIAAGVLSAAFLVVPAPAPAADDAAALLAKHQAYVGWQIGDGVVKTLRATGTITDGKNTDTITLLRYGIATRQTVLDDHGLAQDGGFTGSVYWTTSANGFTLRPVGEIARYFFDREALLGELNWSLKPEVLRHETVDGTDTVVLQLTSDVGFPMLVFEDPTTGAYKRAVIDPGGKYETAYNGLGYTEVNGKRFVSTYHVNNSKFVTTYTAFTVNGPMTPDELHPPKQTATWTFAEGSAPIELTTGDYPRILIDVVMNGVKGRFILDTGAGGTVMLDSFARKIGANPIQKTSISGIGGSVSANQFRVDTIAIGPSVLHNVIVESGLPEEWKEQEGIVGLIGFDLLAGAIVSLDLDAGTLSVMDPQTTAPDTSKGIVVHADLSDHHIRVPMKLNSKYDVIATLDSGNPLNVLFSDDLINRDHMPFLVSPLDLGSVRYGGGVGGLEIERCGKLSSLDLGPIHYAPVPACDSGFEYRNEVLVGLDFMKNFNYVFDYPEGIVVMIPRK